jgi:hypothetical protein
VALLLLLPLTRVLAVGGSCNGLAGVEMEAEGEPDGAEGPSAGTPTGSTLGRAASSGEYGKYHCNVRGKNKQSGQSSEVR